MAFYSVVFITSLILFLILHDLMGHICPRRQWIVRLLASVAFFFYLSGAKIVFLITSALTIWGGSLYIQKLSLDNRAFRKREGITKEEKALSKKKCKRSRRIVMWTIVLFNLALLLATKYILPAALRPIGLPLGISFYTLQAISYTVDVYGEKYEPQRNPFKLMLYLCWFPQMLQGPINRYDTISTTLYEPYRLHAPQFRTAFYIMLFGALKKYAIADLLAPIVNSTLNNSSADYPGSYLLFGAIVYAIELYANFSGGIDMAIGASSLFGVKMDENFRQPFFSTSLAEFWRRWHISLGTWMRDYAFYPFVITKPISKMNKNLGKRFGNHIGRSVTGGIVNILVFMLVGLWHGREHHYLVWGLYNGLIIAVSDALAPMFQRFNAFVGIRDDSRGMYCFRILRTFMIIVLKGYLDVIGPVSVGLACFYNTFFRFDLSMGCQMISRLFADNTTSPQAIVTACSAIALLIINSVLKEKGRSPLNYVCTRAFYARYAIFLALTMILMYSFTVSSGIRSFMYAQF